MAGNRSFKTAEIQAATTILAAETVIGDEIDVRNYDTMVVFFDYTNGDETSWELIPKFLRVPGGDEHQLTQWSNDAAGIISQRSFINTASAKSYVIIDVRALTIIKLYGDATGGTPTGTVQVGYSLLSQ